MIRPAVPSTRQLPTSVLVQTGRLLRICNDLILERRLEIHGRREGVEILVTSAPAPRPLPAPLCRLLLAERRAGSGRALTPSAVDVKYLEETPPRRRVRKLPQAAGRVSRGKVDEGAGPVSPSSPEGAGFARRRLRGGNEAERQRAAPSLPSPLLRLGGRQRGTKRSGVSLVWPGGRVGRRRGHVCHRQGSETQVELAGWAS